MPLWTLDTPPTWFPDAELTKEGWLNHATGELLVAMQGEEDRVGPGTGLQRTLAGTARIQIRDPQDQLGSAAIQNTTVQVQLGIGRLQITTDQTIVGGSAVQNTTRRTQVANASVYNTVIQTQAGVSDIRVTTQQTMLGGAIVVQTISLPNLLVEYGFYENGNTLEIVDLTGNGNNGTLSATGTYTNLGLRLDGTQTISIPNAALRASTQPFTVFALIQAEHVEDGTQDQIVSWSGAGNPSHYEIYYDAADQLAIDLEQAAWKQKFLPAVNQPFAVVQRYDPSGQQLDTRLSVNSMVATEVGIYDFSGVTPAPYFIAQNGQIGPIRGTLIYFAIFQGDISNGCVGHLFKFAYNLLLVRGTNTF
jgi:hypothetical protein